MQDRRSSCQAALVLAAGLNLAVAACHHASDAGRKEAAIDPLCASTLEAAARAPTPSSLGALAQTALVRGDDSDVSRLAERACPLGWLAMRDAAGGRLARRVAEQCNDAEAILALVCTAKQTLPQEDSEVIVAWAAGHPAPRADDGPAVAHAARLLTALEGAETARAALERVAFPRR